MAEGALEYRIYRASDAEAVTGVLADAFPPRDPLALAMRVSRAEFADFVGSLLPEAAQDGLTVVACLASGEVVGVMLNNDGAADSAGELAGLNEKFGPIAGILGELDEMYLAGRESRRGEMVHLYLLGISDRVAGRGVAQELVARSVDNGARRGYRVAFAEATNRTSQHIFRKLGFAERAQILYSDYVFRGRKVFAEFAAQGGPMLMEKVLQA